jgi:TolB protein
MFRVDGLILGLILVAGCQTTRQVTITSDPAGAMIRIDGVERGPAPLADEKLVWKDADDVRQITASKRGYKDRTLALRRDDERTTIELKLAPESKRVTINVGPVPAIISVDGRPLNPEPVSTIASDIEFFLDARGNFRDRTITADRPGYERAEATVSFNDGKTVYQLALAPMSKDLEIATTPPGAEVMLDGKSFGRSPVRIERVPFDVNPQGEWVPKRIRVSKPGYDPVEQTISWDDGRTAYSLALVPKSKKVRMVTTPGNAVVTVDGKQYKSDDAGVAIIDLTFPPTNDLGDLKVYNAVVTRKTADSEWYPVELPIAWDNGRTDYAVSLREVLTTPVPLLAVGLERKDQGWTVVPQVEQTIGAKATTEGGDRQSPVRLFAAPKGQSIGSLAVSPDGQFIVFSVLSIGERGDFRGQLRMARTDGTGGVSAMTDGQTLDVCPAFTPNGQQIVFSSNRAGRRGGGQLNVWSINADGTGGIKRLMAGSDTCDLWPVQDSDPEPRLFYEAWVDGRADPRIYMTQLGTVFQTDITQLSGMQPRISPKNDTIVFVSTNEKSGKRDLYRMSDRGGASENLTNTPDIDERDPAWSKDGARVAFAADSAVDGEGRKQYDIWVLDPAAPQSPVQVTTNASQDDCPVWDPTGGAIYFRSNRGGEWGIWKIAVPRR